jgi:hypothetical protein
MANRAGAIAAAALALAVASPARAGVDVLMRVEGPRGPFVTRDVGIATAIRVTSVQLDFLPVARAPTAAPRPVLITRPIDEISWQLLDALAADDPLQVVITIVQASPDAGPPHRRVVTLSNARVLSIHSAMDTTGAARPGLGFETIAFAYDRIEVVDDGVRVFSAGS